MRLRTAVLGMMVLGAGAGASAAPKVVVDWGLHRAWRVESDGAHPERPARLVEVPWNNGRATGEAEPRPRETTVRPPAVRAGMPVVVVRRGAMAEIRLQGTAMGTAATGQGVAVRAGLGGSTIRGIVRGPGLVELAPEKTR